jgi:hypothetical protein
MASPRLSARRFATAVIAVEYARQDDTPSAAGERITKAIHGRIGKVVGSGGFDVLLKRSLALATRNHPVLAGMSVGERGSLVTAHEPAPDPVAMRTAVAALLATFVELLAELIGEDLAFRLVGDAWPESPGREPSEPDEE